MAFRVLLQERVLMSSEENRDCSLHLLS